MRDVNPFVVLAASLLMALGSWFVAHESYEELLDVKTVGEGLFILGGVVLAWLGKSPIPPPLK